MHVCKKRKPRASSIKMEEGENLIAGALDEGQGKTLIYYNLKNSHIFHIPKMKCIYVQSYVQSCFICEILDLHLIIQFACSCPVQYTFFTLYLSLSFCIIIQNTNFIFYYR